MKKVNCRFKLSFISELRIDEALLAGFVESVDVQNPGYDYIPPELVTLFITNLSVCRLLSAAVL